VEPWAALAAMVAVSALARAWGGLSKATPAYFPDEYLYSALGRSIAETGAPLVRGAGVAFPALLQPILTAPAWWVENVGLSYRLIQVVGALVMSLAAVPVFVLARRLGVRDLLALGAAALTLAAPALLYAGWMMSEPFAYPLALAAVTVGVHALAGGGRRAQGGFFVLTLLATLARAQLSVLALCYIAAALVVGLRRRSVGRTLREQAVLVGAFAVPVLLVLATDPARVLGGGYASTAHLDFSGALVERLGHNALGLIYASGWILVPGAIVGLALAIARPRSDAELAFGALAACVVAALLLQSSLWGDLERIQERYFFYVVPLVGVLFALCVSRGWPRRAHALLAAALLLLAPAVPLSGYAAGTGLTQSPFLFAVARLQRTLGVADASLLVAVVATLLSLAAIGLSLRARAGGPIALVAACAVCVTASIGATLFDVDNSRGVRQAFLPADRSWVDANVSRETPLLYAAARRADAHAQLFWNRHVDRVLLLAGTEGPDPFQGGRVTIAPDGELREGTAPLRGSLLLDQWGVFTRLHGARMVASAPHHDLWRTEGEARLSVLVIGWYADRWLGARGSFNVWPEERRGRLEGRLTLRLSSPSPEGSELHVTSEGGRTTTHQISAEEQTIEIPVCGDGPWALGFTAGPGIFDGDRAVALYAEPPQWRADPSACA
jgi:hypothetical protein